MLSLAPVVDALVLLAAVPGVYTPKGGTAVNVLAIAGRDVQDATPNRGVRKSARSQDWLMPVQCWIDGVLTTMPVPAVGDQLRITYQDRETVWELRAEGQQPAWEWSDREKRLRRLHCVEISEEMND